MNPQAPFGFTSKLENAFLGILRVVILLVLLLSLIGAVALVITSISGLNAKPANYEFEQPDNGVLINSLKNSLKKQNSSEKNTEGQPSSSDSEQISISVSDQALDQEIDIQTRLFSDFLNKFNRHLADEKVFKKELLDNARKNAFHPEQSDSVLSYAKGQTAFFRSVLSDQDILSGAGKRHDQELGQLFGDIVKIYPQSYADAKNRHTELVRQEELKNTRQHTQALYQLYIAGGLFASFLVISLILVLIKIERNLRYYPTFVSVAQSEQE
jgi:hypothetical protein